jgi:cellulose synthase/poly-beta-1,6-N-acetylglucosamine synthase-like glycosyltransferase
MNELTLIVIFLISIINIFFIIIIKKRVLSKNETRDKELNFSIVVAAKNEEESISSLIDSLKNVNYPKDKFEVIIADDDSLDNTYQKVRDQIKELTNFAIYKADEKELPAKKGALQFAISKAENPFILITDADCIVSSNWLGYYANAFNNDFDFLFGIAPFEQGKILVNKVSCFENLRTSILTFSLALAGLPYSASARNFGFRKSAFEKLDGYKNTTETLSGDDDLLLRQAVKNEMKIGIILNKDCHTISKAKTSFYQYFKQKSRHTKTSLYYLSKHKIILGFWHILNIFLLLSIVLVIFSFKFIFIFLAKIIWDFIVVFSLQKTFMYKFSFGKIFYLQLLYEVFIIINFFNALTKKEEWK